MFIITLSRRRIFTYKNKFDLMNRIWTIFFAGLPTRSKNENSHFQSMRNLHSVEKTRRSFHCTCVELSSINVGAMWVHQTNNKNWSVRIRQQIVVEGKKKLKFGIGQFDSFLNISSFYCDRWCDWMSNVSVDKWLAAIECAFIFA